MKTILTVLTAIVAYLGSGLSIIWAAIEFILYLVKDKPFNWMSVWSLVLCVSVSMVLFVLAAFLKAKQEIAEEQTFNTRMDQKIAEMKRKRGI